MVIKHIKKRIFSRGSSAGVTTLCGAKVGKRSWYVRDAREFLRLTETCKIPALHYGEEWEFCLKCKEKL